jgi:hypothetical protein
MTPTIPSKDTIVTLCQLHSLPSEHVPPFTFDFQPKHTFVLDMTLFVQALTIAPHLFLGGLSRMVYEHLSRCFILRNPSSRFSKLFQIVAIAPQGDIPRLMALVLGVSRLLVMAKNTGNLCPIIVGKAFLRLISCSIIL